MSLSTPASELLEEVRSRTIQVYLSGAVALATEVGLTRNENQDRVVALQTFHPDLGPPTFLAAVADGMGGMVDGGTCATLTLSNFIDEFTRPASGSLALRLVRSAAKANEEVFERYRTKGGSTLSAVAVTAGGTVGINVGDSRIYASSMSGFVQLTTDDTLSAAFGAEGNGLIQFIGMGQGLRSHLIEIPSSHMVFVTSDGAHYPEQDTFGRMMSHSPEPKAAAERALALARWLGSPDNASVIAINLPEVTSRLAASETKFFAMLGLSGAVEVIGQPRPIPRVPSPEKSTDAPPRNPQKKRARSKKKKPEKTNGQLRIDIEPSGITGEDSE